MAIGIGVNECNMLLADALTQWRAWSVDQQPKLVKEFAAGLNHMTVQLACGDQQYCLKIFNGEGANAIRAQSWAAQHGLAPRVIYHHPEWRYLVMELLDEPGLSGGAGPSRLEALGRALRILHSGDAPDFSTETFSLLDYCEQYLFIAGDRAKRIHAKLLPSLTQHQNNPTPKCFCHNDLVAANCFLNDHVATFIDWEYAALNSPWFDLAAVTIYFRLSPQEINQLVTAYRPQLLPELSKTVFLDAQIACLWLDILWYLHRFGERYWSKLTDKKRLLSQLAQQRGINLA